MLNTFPENIIPANTKKFLIHCFGLKSTMKLYKILFNLLLLCISVVFTFFITIPPGITNLVILKNDCYDLANKITPIIIILIAIIFIVDNDSPNITTEPIITKI